MILLQIVILILVAILLIRSINHDNRMSKMERFIGKILRSIKAAEQESMIGSGNAQEDFTEEELKELNESLLREVISEE